MSSNDLIEEFGAAVRGRSLKTDTFLRNLGLTEAVLYSGASLVGRGKAILEDNGLFTPHESGRDVLVVAEGQRDSSGIGWGFISDLIAFLPHAPHRWWRRTGDAVILNDEAVDRASFLEEQLAVWSSPLSWLQHGAHGAVVLEWQRHLPMHFRAVKRIAAENDLLALRLAAALKPPVTPPVDVQVIDTAEASHAA